MRSITIEISINEGNMKKWNEMKKDIIVLE